MKQTIIYETGATSHAVNDLILFTDTSAKLARDRDVTYTDRATNVIDDYNMYWQFYYTLFTAACVAYRHETGKPYLVTRSHKLREASRREYAQLFANYYPTWKKEHGSL